MSRSDIEMRAELAGSIWKVFVSPGDAVLDGQQLLVMETMKMEIPVMSEADGTVVDVNVSTGEQVREGDVLVVVGVAR